MISRKAHLERLMKDPEFKKEYDALEPWFRLQCKLIEAREKKRLTQAQLAKKLGTKQSAISRIERGDGNPTLGFLNRMADALDVKMKVTFE